MHGMSFVRNKNKQRQAPARQGTLALSNQPLADQLTERVPELLLEAKVVPAG